MSHDIETQTQTYTDTDADTDADTDTDTDTDTNANPDMDTDTGTDTDTDAYTNMDTGTDTDTDTDIDTDTDTNTRHRHTHTHTHTNTQTKTHTHTQTHTHTHTHTHAHTIQIREGRLIPPVLPSHDTNMSSVNFNTHAMTSSDLAAAWGAEGEGCPGEPQYIDNHFRGVDQGYTGANLAGGDTSVARSCVGNSSYDARWSMSGMSGACSNANLSCTLACRHAP